MALANWVEPLKTEAVCKTDLPWNEKYRPQRVIEVVGNPASIEEVKKWADQWKAGKPKKKALLIYGTVGTGKTSLAYALANECCWEVLEMNASDKRNQEVVEQIAGLGSQTMSLSGKTKVVLVEEIEGLSGMADRGASKALAEVIKETRCPIILTCNDLASKKLSGIKVYCEQIQLKKLSPGSVVKRLGEILAAEGIKAEDVSVLQKIAENADGDLRSAINDLQAMAQGEKIIKKDSVFLDQRDRPIDVYKAMQKVFKCKDYAECRRVAWDLDIEPDNFVAWLDENIPLEYKSKSERGKAFNQLSRADIFLGRVTNRQYWGFLRYVNDLTTVGVGFSREKPSFDFVQYKFPSMIGKMGATRAKRAKEKAVSAKISPIVHDSRKKIIIDYLPLLQRVFKKSQKNGEAMVSKFKLAPEDMDLFC